jgi:hypothetical protein
MTNHPTIFMKPRMKKIFLLLSIFVAGFWIIGLIINVYRFTITGVLFEIIWLPALALTIALPIMSFMSWINEGFNIKSLYLLSIIIITASILITQFIK